MTDREMLKQVLDVLAQYSHTQADQWLPAPLHVLRKEIRAHLAQPEQEPIGWLMESGHGTIFRKDLSPEHQALEHGGVKMWRPVYDHPVPAGMVLVAHCHLEMWRSGAHHTQDCFSEIPFSGSVPIYTAQPVRAMVPMTDAEVKALWWQCESRFRANPEDEWWMQFARAVEAHYGIGKETP